MFKPIPDCPADLNADGEIDVLDLFILLERMGGCPPTEHCPADLNGDGTVDVQDVLLLIDSWGRCSG